MWCTRYHHQNLDALSCSTGLLLCMSHWCGPLDNCAYCTYILCSQSLKWEKKPHKKFTLYCKIHTYWSPSVVNLITSKRRLFLPEQKSKPRKIIVVRLLMLGPNTMITRATKFMLSDHLFCGMQVRYVW